MATQATNTTRPNQQPAATAKPRRRYRFKWGRIKLVVILVAFAYVLWSIVTQQAAYSAEATKLARLRAENAELQQQMDFYTNSEGFIGSDEYVEQEARERFGWLKPDEVKYVAGTEDTTFQAPSGGSSSTEATSAPNSAGPGAVSPESAGYGTTSGDSAGPDQPGASATAGASETPSPTPLPSDRPGQED